MNSAEIEGWVKAAKSAFQSAKDLDELKQARLAHAGDKSPISGASRNLGSLPADQKAEMGKLIGAALLLAGFLASVEDPDELRLPLDGVHVEEPGNSPAPLGLFEGSGRHLSEMAWKKLRIE